MSARERADVQRREPASHAVAGYLAAVALFAGIVGIVYRPGQVGPGAMLIALLAAAMGGPHRRLAGIALVIVTVSWIAGMIIAVVLERPLW